MHLKLCHWTILQLKKINLTLLQYPIPCKPSSKSPNNLKYLILFYCSHNNTPYGFFLLHCLSQQWVINPTFSTSGMFLVFVSWSKLTYDFKQ